jgi:predicted TIM-barrel fold metal-dependent hydrolase
LQVIDCQSHVFPETYARLLTRSRGGALRATGGDGVYTLDYHAPGPDGQDDGPVQRFVLRLDEYSVERKLAGMDAAGVAVSVLSVNIPSPDWLEPPLAHEGAAICNDYLAELCARYPKRFVGLASLPLPDVPAAIAELDRAVDELGLRGVFLCSHLNGLALDAPVLEPFYAHVAQRGIPLVLHPAVPVWGAAIRDHAMIPMLGLMVETSIAMLRLILGGVLERHPDLLVVHPHAGGVLPYLMGRVEEQTEVKRRGREQISQPPGAYYRRVYLDLVSPSPLALQFAYDFAGPERLLFASDHPWVGIPDILELVRGRSWPEDKLAQVLAGNARRLFRI